MIWSLIYEDAFNIEFITDITITQGNCFFLCSSDYIRIGSSSLKNDGTRPIITITNTADYYDGLIINGDNSTTGKNNIYIYNLFINGVPLIAIIL